jgi:hypothetical protein
LRGYGALDTSRHPSSLYRSPLNTAVYTVCEESNAEQQREWSTRAAAVTVESDEILKDK